MPEKQKFRIVFTGRYTEGRRPEDVHASVARLFSVDPARVSAAFSKGKGAVVGSASEIQKAQRLLEGLMRAGAICAIEPSPEMPPRKPVAGPPRALRQEPDRIAEFERALPGALVVAPSIGPASDITLAPLYSPRITGHAEGIDINRKDRRVIPFGSIVAVSFFKASESPERFMLMLFFEESKRPVLVETGNIIYGDFPGVGAQSMLGSLKNFLMLLHSRREGMVFDAQTAVFLSGGQPGVFLKDPLLLATALYQAMPEGLRPAPSKSVSYGAGLELNLPDDTVERCARCGSRLITGRPDCPRCGFIPLKPEAPAQSALPSPEAKPARLALWGAGLLVLSFAIPLLRTPNPAIWAWRFFGIGSDGNGTLAALAGRSGLMLGLWAAVPLIAAGVVLAAAKLSHRFAALNRWRFHLMALAGGLGLFALVVPLAAYSTLLGLEMLPQYWKHGIFLFASILSGFWLMHASDKLEDGLRRLMVFAAVVGLVAGLVLLFIYSPAWKTWWLLPLYAGAVMMGLLGLLDASGILSGNSLPELYRRMGVILALLSVMLVPLAGVWMRYGSTGAIWQRLIPELVNNAKAMLVLAGLGVVLEAGLWGMGIRSGEMDNAPLRKPKPSPGILPRASTKTAAKQQPKGKP